MLGSAMVEEFAGFEGEVSRTARSRGASTGDASKAVLSFDAERDSIETLKVKEFDYIINCIGLIKSAIMSQEEKSVRSAVKVNTNLPFALAGLANETGAKVIQIATDCVFSGDKGSYSETDPHDAEDVYGKTKSLGEVPSKHMMHIRASIIGKENRGHTSLYDWVRFQPLNAEVTGYTDHVWNGVTSNHFARITRSIVENDLFSAGVNHLLPSDVVTKFELIQEIALHESRTDIKIIEGQSGHAIDRSLSTTNPSFSETLWKSIGFETPPNIKALIGQI